MNISNAYNWLGDMKRNKYLAIFVILSVLLSGVSGVFAGMLCSKTMKPVAAGHTCCCPVDEPAPDASGAPGLNAMARHCDNFVISARVDMTLDGKANEFNRIQKISNSGEFGQFDSGRFFGMSNVLTPSLFQSHSLPILLIISSLRC